MNIEIICSGFGGQGVLTTGMLMAYAFHRSGKNITWYPSYGSEGEQPTAWLKRATVKLRAHM